MYVLSRVHNITVVYRVCLTAYTCFKHTESSTKSTPFGVDQISALMSKRFYNSIKQNAGMHVLSIILLSMIWCIKKIFVDEKKLCSTPAPSLKKYVHGKLVNTGLADGAANCYEPPAVFKSQRLFTVALY